MIHGRWSKPRTNWRLTVKKECQCALDFISRPSRRIGMENGLLRQSVTEDFPSLGLSKTSDLAQEYSESEVESAELKSYGSPTNAIVIQRQRSRLENVAPQQDDVHPKAREDDLWKLEARDLSAKLSARGTALSTTPEITAICGSGTLSAGP
ncbi:MAG: hypothetical protein ACKO5F_13705, partial [Synechococcus sp.]